MSILEATRQELINKSKNSHKGLERYNKRGKSKIQKSTQQMNDIDMDSLFKKGILNVALQVKGETANYIVKIKFEGFLKEIQELLNKKSQTFDIRTITQALSTCFNREDTYVNCSCDDFKFRHEFWATRNNYIDSPPEQHSNGKWVNNPKDTLGSACKHVLLALSNNVWLSTVARVIFNYVDYMKNHKPNLYEKIIYPAIYGTEYTEEEPDDNDDDVLDKSDIKTANDERRVAGQFKKGNQSGYQFVKKDTTPIENERSVLGNKQLVDEPDDSNQPNDLNEQNSEQNDSEDSSLTNDEK